jgi:hypothetical protein
LIFHFGGYQYDSGHESIRYFCLILVRPASPPTSGCAHPYLLTSQNRFWQSTSCSGLPHSGTKTESQPRKLLLLNIRHHTDDITRPKVPYSKHLWIPSRASGPGTVNSISEKSVRVL